MKISRLLPASARVYLRSVLNKNNFTQPHERTPVDLRNLSLDLPQAFEICCGTPFLLDISVADCRGLRGLTFPCDCYSTHPFIVALNKYKINKDIKSVEQVLALFYEMVEPSTVGQLLGLAEKKSHPFLFLNPLCYQYPWDGIPNAKLQKTRISFITREAVSHGAVNIYQGWHHFGPLTKERIFLEATRLVRVYEEISQTEYKRNNSSDGDVEGVVLHSDKESKVLITQGHHRIAAIAVLGHEKITVRFGKSVTAPFVSRDQAEQWVGVNNGGFNLDDARMVFDRIFSGNQPSICNDWNSYQSHVLKR